MGILLLIFSLVFNSGNADSTSPATELEKIVLSATDRCVSGVSVAEKVYRAKEGYGIKFGTASVKGRLVLQLDGTYAITRITVTAAPYSGEAQSTKGFSILGSTIGWQSSSLQPYPLTPTTAYTTSVLDIEALQDSKNRFYISRIDFEAADPYPTQTRITAPYSIDFGSLPIVDGEPAGDVQDVIVTARNTADSLRLRLKVGNVFTLNQQALPHAGGEINITCLTATPNTTVSDTLFIEHIAIPIKISTYIPKPVVLDTIPCLLDYGYAEGLSDSLLKSALGEIAQCGLRYRYGAGHSKSWDGFYHTDRDTVTNRVLDMYSLNLRYFNPANPTASVSGFDIEHMFPKSWWGGTVNRAYCDLYHLVPGDYSANRSKSNHAPGYITDTTFYNGSFATGGNTAYPVAKVFCPDDDYKGDFARAYFYIATAYGDSLSWVRSGEPSLCMTNASYLEFQPWLVEVLLAWHRADPVSIKEIERAHQVQAIQGNRNPYIDYPDLVEYIWGNRQGQAYHFDEPTAIEAVRDLSGENIRKILRSGKLLIVREGKTYTVLGAQL